ncbi:DUF602-domain-containing protein [Thelephora ganbajun]|uniref:DUF602-domain-containing protein n=1 Tax=Thelephora ganbajun TaxID=370292 RepID=A0ACB6ZAD2_THEGA|nr:DUF602-domain-containing protein [Thelephora ganbajun]
MGNDGGSIPDRRDLVRTKAKAEQADKANQTRARWFFCALSKRLLQEPIVSCALGKLYNKDAVLEYLLDKSSYGDGEVICGHIRSLKDVKVLKLTHNPSPDKSTPINGDTLKVQFVCPLTFKEMLGSVPFVYIPTCGCVFSQAGLKTVSRADNGSPKDDSKEASPVDSEKQYQLCPSCGTKYDQSQDVLILNPSPKEEAIMHAIMLKRRAAEPTKTKGKKRKAVADAEQPSTKKKATVNSSNTGVSSATRAVVASLAEEEAKRKANMSDTIKSLYVSKGGPKRKETFMTMGTFTRYA